MSPGRMNCSAAEWQEAVRRGCGTESRWIIYAGKLIDQCQRHKLSHRHTVRVNDGKCPCHRHRIHSLYGKICATDRRNTVPHYFLYFQLYVRIPSQSLYLSTMMISNKTAKLLATLTLHVRKVIWLFLLLMRRQRTVSAFGPSFW